MIIHRNRSQNRFSKSLLIGITVFVSQNISAQSWIQTDKTDAADRQATDQFGYYVDVDGSYAISGANYQRYDSNGMNSMFAAGAAYIYERSTNGTWNQVQKLSAPDRAADDQEEFFTDIQQAEFIWMPLHQV